MGADPGPGGLRRAFVLALAGAAFALGVVATLELVSLALPGRRSTFRTWGPVVTAVAGGAILVVGVPGATLVEAITPRSGNRTRTTIVGYLAVALGAGAVLWLLWRALVAPGANLLALTREYLVLAAGAIAIWGGARLAERISPAPLFAFGGAALLLVVVTTALFRA